MPKQAPTFAAHLASLRGKAGLSQQALANKAGVNRSCIAKLEAGAQEPSWSTLQKLADALGVTTEAFR